MEYEKPLLRTVRCILFAHRKCVKTIDQSINQSVSQSINSSSNQPSDCRGHERISINQSIDC